MFKLFVLFIVMPIVEIALLLEVGDLIGGWPTLGLVILTAFLGAKLLRQQGSSTLQEIQQKTASGEIPGNTLIEGLMLLVAGILLITPGFITDIIGFILIVPVTRKPLSQFIFSHLKNHIHIGANMHGEYQAKNGFQQDGFHYNQGAHVNGPTHKEGKGSVIEGEFQRKD